MNSIPEEFICPITQTLMADPYVDTDGNSYEKEAIMDWLRRKSVSPITRNPMNTSNVFPNRTLRSLIERFKADNPDLVFEARELAPAESKEAMDPAGRAALGRKPLVLYAVIDVSGSMQNPCDNKTRYDTEEGEGFSRLDLVKHTLATIISSLSAFDRICVIEFSTSASVFIRLTALTDANKETLLSRIRELEPEGQTNIWDGMRLAVDEASALLQNSEAKGEEEDSNVAIYLLTDGEPTINPPGPIAATIANYIQRKCTTLPVVSTFGYGYQLDSAMLYEISTMSVRGSEARGVFGFIPDASMVGTVFINALTHSLYSHGNGNGSRRTVHFADAPLMSSLMDSLLHGLGQLVAPNTSEEARTATLAFMLSQAQRALEMHVAAMDRAADRDNAFFAKSFLVGLIRDLTATDDPHSGQIAKAISPAFIGKWGVHYLRSLRSAFGTRQCINFKDAAMQAFQACDAQLVGERARIEDIFLAIPAPAPSLAPSAAYYGSSSRGAPSAAAPAPANMARYYNVSGGCFGASSGVHTPQGVRPIGQLLPGDRVCSADGTTEVVAVLSMPYSGTLYLIGDNLLVTPYHPVTVQGADSFPAHLPAALATPQEVQGIKVYDVVLANRSLLTAPFKQGDSSVTVLAASLGHRCARPTYAHPYFAGDKMVQDLTARFKGEGVWALGAQDIFLRNSDGAVCGLQFGDHPPQHLPHAVPTAVAEAVM